MEVRDILFVSVVLVIAVMTIIGNVVVILAVFSHRRLQNPANYLIVNLALSDLLQGAVSMPLRLIEVLNTSDENLIRCDLVLSVSILFHGASNANLALIAMDRFVAVSKPFSYANIVKTSNYKVVIAFTWIFILILSFCPVVGWRRDTSSQDSAGSVCRYGTTLTQEYLILYFLLIDFIPLAIMLSTYTYIFQTTRKQIRQIRAQEIAVTNAAINQAFYSRNNSQSNIEPTEDEDVGKATNNCKENETVPSNNNNLEVANSQEISTSSNRPATRRVPLSTMRTRKATRTVLAIIGFFLVLCIPITIIDAIELWCKTCGNIPSWVTTLAICMVSANACVNVFVYGGYNTDYRKAYRKVWRRTKQVLLKPFTPTKNKSSPQPPRQS